MSARRGAGTGAGAGLAAGAGTRAGAGAGLAAGAAAAALAAVAALAGCADDGAAPSTQLVAPRLLAIAADPPVVGLDGASALRALVVDGDGREAAVEVAWRACSPWQVVRDPEVDCAPAVALALAVEPDGAARLDVAAAIARFGRPPVLPAPTPCQPATVAVPVIATTVIDGLRLVARKDVAVGSWVGPPRRPPTIAAVTLDGDDARTYRPGAEHTLAALPARASLDESCTADDQPVLEPVRMWFYTTAGALDEPSADVRYQPDGSEAAGSVRFTGPADGGVVRLWTIAIDRDAGTAWALRELTPR